MYSKTLSLSCRRQCPRQIPNRSDRVYGNLYRHLLLFNRHYGSNIAQSHQRHSRIPPPINTTPLHHSSLRSFSSKPPDKYDHDDIYLELDEDDESPQEEVQKRSRRWKAKDSKQERIEGTYATSETAKPSRLDSLKSVINRPFAAIKSKMSRKKKSDDDADSKPKIQKERMPSRPGKRSLPSPEQGVMTFIPKHKAQILHILQEECNIFPDEVFPLFPDHKTEGILAGTLCTVFLSHKITQRYTLCHLLTSRDTLTNLNHSECVQTS